MEAFVVYTYRDGAETIQVSDHKIQYGYGDGGDGYCYNHGSFDCVDSLTAEEQEAVKHAVRKPV